MKEKTNLILIITCLLAVLAGCDTVHKSRIQLDSTSVMRGMTVSNFSMEEVDSFLRYFIEQKGYEIKFSEGEDAMVASELMDEGSSLIWIAEKQGSPAILFISTDTSLIVSFVQTAGPLGGSEFREYVNVLHALLAHKFGKENMHLVNGSR